MAYETVYLPELNLIQKYTTDGIFTSPAVKTRTTITNSCTWQPQKQSRRGNPLIEHQLVQSIPSMQWAIRAHTDTWAVRHLHSWDKFKSTLANYTIVKKYAELDILTTTNIWIVSDGVLANTSGY